MMVEMLVAFSIITVSVLFASAVAQKSLYVSRQAVHSAQAAFLLEEGAEAVRTLRADAWSNISTLSENTDYYPVFAGGTWTLAASPAMVGIFTRVVRIAPVLRDDSSKNIAASGTEDPDSKLVTVEVSWIEGGTTLTKTLQFYLMNIFSQPSS